MKKKGLRAYTKIIFSFMLVIIIGTILLSLPFAVVDGHELNIIDTFFIATSSVCVTGLTPIEIGSTFTFFGQFVILLLMEIGGIGCLTIAVFLFVIMGRHIGINERFMMKEALNQNSTSGVVKLIKIIIILALSIQLAGAIVNMFVFTKDFAFGKALWLSVFHAASSFNNAGIDILIHNQNNPASFMMYNENILFNLNTMVLIVLGGIGFIVLIDIYKKRRIKKFNVHTKIVLITSGTLILVGALGFYLLTPMSLFESFFHSISARTAAFSTVDTKILTNPALILLIFLMIIGASPASTGGGIKTTTFFVLIVTLINMANNKPNKVFKRKIAEESVFKAFSLVLIVVLFLICNVFIISILEPSISMLKLVFECVSALSTAGFSLGVTPLLSDASKMVLTVSMFLGRLGPLTLISMWGHNRLREQNENIKYIEEKIIIG